jgi:glycosyltransferase involved in cell wall biosynthesis
MNTPVFSIITPTCRRPLLLKRNIISVMNQTFGNYEHIIIDDANEMETVKITAGFKDTRIILLQHEFSKGAAGSYNTGIRASRGQFILFLDDDDEYLPCFLKKMHDRFSQSGTNVGYIWTGISRIKDTDNIEEHLFSIIWPSKFHTREEGLIAATSIGNGFGVCIRKEFIKAIGQYDESLTVCEDTDFLFRLAQCVDFETIPEALVKIHQHGNTQLTGNQNYIERVKCKEKVLARYNILLNQYSKLFSTHYKAYADLCYKSNMKRKGRKAMLSIITKRPFRIIYYSDLFFYELFGKDTHNIFSGCNLNKLVIFLKEMKLSDVRKSVFY